MNTDFITHEDEAFYHGQSKSGKYMSSHLLADFRKSPLLYHKKVLGQIEEQPSSALAIGTAAHKLILEGEGAFDAEYVVTDGPVNPKTGEPYGSKTKAYAEWLVTQERKVLSPEDYGLIVKMYTSVHGNREIVDLLWGNEALSKGEAEGVVRAELRGVPCQIRMDYFHPASGLIDLKTTAELQYFEYDAKRFGYVYQMAFYRAVIRAVTGVTVPVHIIAVEKAEPFASGLWLLTPEVLDLAEASTFAALDRYKQCMDTGIWPTGYETPRIIDSL